MTSKIVVILCQEKAKFIPVTLIDYNFTVSFTFTDAINIQCQVYRTKFLQSNFAAKS